MLWKKKTTLDLEALLDLCGKVEWRLEHVQGESCREYASETRSWLLLEVASTRNDSDAFHAGANPNLSAKDRLRLARMNSYASEAGRMGLILNPATTQEELDILSASDDNHVRKEVVWRAADRLSQPALEAASKDHTIADTFAEITGLPEWAYRNLIEQDMPSSVWNLRILAENPSAPKDFLALMASGELGFGESFERVAILNPSTPIDSILSIPAHFHIEAVEEALTARASEVAAWVKEQYDAEISLDEVPVEWVRETFGQIHIPDVTNL